MLDVTANSSRVTVAALGQSSSPILVHLPDGQWEVERVDDAGKVVSQDPAHIVTSAGGYSLAAEGRTTLRFTRR